MCSNIVKISTIIENIDVKLSETTSTNIPYQIVCLVLRNNNIVLRYTKSTGKISYRILKWFTEQKKFIRNICFSSNGKLLLAVCNNNTLHVVPVLHLLDNSVTESDVFLSRAITSYTIPFRLHKSTKKPGTSSQPNQTEYAPTQRHFVETTRVQTVAQGETRFLELDPNLNSTNNMDNDALVDVEEELASHSPDDESAENDTSLLNPYVYPTCVAWWESAAADRRAVIGYSDGSLCIIGLCFSCPLLGYTYIERGGVESLSIYHDTESETCSLLINSTEKCNQWKLILEKKKYIFPGEFVTETLKVRGSFTSMDLPADVEDEKLKLNTMLSTPSIEVEQNNEEKPAGIAPEATALSSITIPNTSVFSDISLLRLKHLTEEENKIPSKENPLGRTKLMNLRKYASEKIESLRAKFQDKHIKAKDQEKLKEQIASLQLPGILPENFNSTAEEISVSLQLMGSNKHYLSVFHYATDILSVHSLDYNTAPMYLFKLPGVCHGVLITNNIMYMIKYSPLQMVKSLQSMPSLTAADAGTPTPSVAGREENIFSQQDKDSNCDHQELELEHTDESVCVLSCFLASRNCKEEEQMYLNRATLGTFSFPGEIIQKIHRLKTMPDEEFSETFGLDVLVDRKENNGGTSGTQKSSEQSDPLNKYVFIQNYIIDNIFPMRLSKDSGSKSDNIFSQIMNNKFPKVHFERALVVTDRNIYTISMTKPPHLIFLDLANDLKWDLCEEFCKIFNLSMEKCSEFAGDIFLKQNTATKALLAYEIGNVPISKIVTKLAMYNEIELVLKLCGPILGINYIITSKFIMNSTMRFLIKSSKHRNVDNKCLENALNRTIDPTKPDDDCNCSIPTSDFSYSNNAVEDVQRDFTYSVNLSLTNLCLVALCERCQQDKNYIPLWNFIVTNKQYNKNLASIILSKTGLYSSAILCAITRGACLEVFSSLVQVIDKVRERPADLDVFMYNISEPIFMACIPHLPNYSIAYFELIRQNIHKFSSALLYRLTKQLNPFHPVYRPIVEHLYRENVDGKDAKEAKADDNTVTTFCNAFLETYLLLEIKKETLTKGYADEFLNAFNFFIGYRDEPNLISRLDNFSPISAGYSHAGCVLNNVAYLWGNTGVHCTYNLHTLHSDFGEFYKDPMAMDILKDLIIHVYAMKCGKQHTMFLTNNGIYAMGCNKYGQLGIGKELAQTLYPVLVSSFDGKVVRILSVGSYHTAVVADDALYTWGWNVYGQLGLGNTFNVRKPQRVDFFLNKNIKQVALGNAHTVVLCNDNELYSFGSNHYGELGLGKSDIPVHGHPKLLKSLVPLRINFNMNITLLTTKYFSNLIVTDTNSLYVWGASPFALRMAVQSQKRAKAQKKTEQSLKTDMIRRTEMANAAIEAATTSSQVPATETASSSTETEVEKVAAPEPFEVRSEIDSSTEKETEAIKEAAAEIEEDEEEVTSVLEIAESVDVFEEYKDHLQPMLIDSSMVNGKITQISCGLYHYALLTAKNKLYTWGKNIDSQLGRKSPYLKDYPTPSPCDIADNILYVECGSDFTIVMTKNYVVKAFGNTNCGQCGKVLQNEGKQMSKGARANFKKRFPRLPELNQCIAVPIEVTLPITTTTVKSITPSSQLKMMQGFPKFRPYLIVPHELSFLQPHRLHYPHQLRRLNSLNASFHSGASESRFSQDGDSMWSLPLTGENSSDNGVDFKNSLFKNHNCFIHYCMFVFYGFYDTKLLDFLLSSDKKSECKLYEYRVRLLMLRQNYLDAFKLVMEYEQEQSGKVFHGIDAKTNIEQLSNNLIKVFEYFTYESINIEPMQYQDIKYFIHEIFNHFIVHNLNMTLLEDFFLQNMNYYLLQLGSLLFYHISNTLQARENADSEDLDLNDMNKLYLDLFNKISNVFRGLTIDSTKLSSPLQVDNIFNNISHKFYIAVREHLIIYANEVAE